MVSALRQWSNRVSLAFKMIPSVIIFWFLLVGHRLILYSNASGSCAARPGFYEQYDIIFEVIMSGMCPPVVLLTLGFALLRSVRQVIHRRIAPAGVANPGPAVSTSYIQQIDAQITTMILLQSFVAIPSFLPYGAQNLYTTISQGWYKSPLRLAWENVIIETIRLFSYVFYSTSFYVSFISSQGFRRALYQALGLKRFRRAGSLPGSMITHGVSHTGVRKHGQKPVSK